MLALKSNFYILLLTINIVFSYDVETFLSKVVNNENVGTKQDIYHKFLPSIKLIKYLRNYNLTDVKVDDIITGYLRCRVPYHFIKRHKMLESYYPINFQNNFSVKLFPTLANIRYPIANIRNHKHVDVVNISKINVFICKFKHIIPTRSIQISLIYLPYLHSFCKKCSESEKRKVHIEKVNFRRPSFYWKDTFTKRNETKPIKISNLICFKVPNNFILFSGITFSQYFKRFLPQKFCLRSKSCSRRNVFRDNKSAEKAHEVLKMKIRKILSAINNYPYTFENREPTKNRIISKFAENENSKLKIYSSANVIGQNHTKSLLYSYKPVNKRHRKKDTHRFRKKLKNIAASLTEQIQIPRLSPTVPKGIIQNNSSLFHEVKKREIETTENVNNTISNSTLEISDEVDFEYTDAETNNSFYNTFENMNPLQRRGEDDVIYIHGLFEMSGGECRVYPQTGRFEYKAAQLAIQHVNEKNVIDGYQVQMYYNDTKCDSGVAVDAFFHSLYRQPTMSVILGTGSSEVTERLARVVSRWNVMQVSYGATSPALSDRENFPMFFRTIAPDSSHNAALLAFVLHHKWLTVAALHEQGDKHALPMTKLVTDLEQVNVTVQVTKGTSERDYKDHLQELKDQDCRIVICSFSSSLFRKIFCQVYHMGMHGAEYAWIILGDTTDSWWEDASETECNDHQLINAIQGVISVGSHYEAVGNGTAVSEVTIAEILDEIGYHTNLRSTGFISQTYDAVWAIALTFRDVERNWKMMNSSSTLRQFTYDNYLMAQSFSSTMGSLRFMGVSGPVSFYNSDRVGITAFHQKQGKVMKLAAIYNPDESQLDFHCAGCSGLIWQGGSPPISRRIIIQRIATLDRRVFICVTALAALGVTLALTFLSFNLYYRKLKFIKLSSPNLNNFVVVGCVLVYIAVILLGVDHGTLISDDHFPVICSARAFLLSGGFSLAFGCMFIKTYRVYHIFIRTNTGIVKSKLLHDQQLLGIVSVLLLVDCVLVTLWVTVDPMERHLINLSLQVNKEERNVEYLYLREHCNSAHMAKWLGSLYIYKGLLLVVGCYMAWETRHVKVPALNDSQYIGMSVYNVVITSIIVVALANVIPADRYTLTFVLVSTLIFVSTTTTLCILFVPKIHTILINPEEAAVVATPGVKVECKTRRFALDEPRESLYRAEVLNRALKRELLELDEEYNRLAEKVGFTPCTVRKPKLSDENQDEDSDDGLPPWLADYKDYSSTGSEEVWYTSRPTIASAFSTIHSVALQLPSTSSSLHKSTSIQNKSDSTLNNPCYSPLRASLTKIDNHKDAPLACSKSVRSFLSDRALNKLKIPQTLRETIFDDVEGSPIPLRNLLPSILKKHLRSEPKLYSGIHSQGNLNFASCPSKSLNQVSALRDSLSDFSKNTSGASDFTTAPLYDSTSFSTPPEDFMSSSNNGNDSHKSAPRSGENNTISNYMSCDEGSSMQESHEVSQNRKDAKLKHDIHSTVNTPTPENSTFCEFSSNKSDTNALSGSSSSVSGATVSDLSTDINEESKQEATNAAISADDSSTRCSSSLKTIQNESQEHSSSVPSGEIRDININIGTERHTVTEVQPSNSTQVNFIDESDGTASDEISAKSNIISNIATNNSGQSSNGVNGNENKTIASQDNNNGVAEPARAVQIDNLRNQIFRLERELILLQLDQSDAVDL